MKATILLIATLFAAGMFFTSCQKDNALVDDFSAMEVKAGPWAEEDNSGNIPMKVKNTPDPFIRYTTIQYNLSTDGWVSLYISNQSTGLVTVLVNEFQEKGVHKLKFDSKDLKPGIYFADLRFGNAIYRDQMTKKHMFQEEDGPIADK